MPAPQQISPPTFSKADLEAPLVQVFGLMVVACWQGFQYYISPSGIFASFTKCFLRWILALLLCVVAIGIPVLVAAQFMDGAAALLESAMRHLMMACLYLALSIFILAALISAMVTHAKRRT